LDSNQQPTG